MDPIGAELAHVGSEIDRSGTSRVLWQKVALIAIAGFFEQYELFSTPFVLPGLVKSGLVTTSATSVFSPHGAAFFIASMYVGVFFGAVVLARTADWIGRRSVLIASLVAYAVSSLITAVQLGIWGINAWRLVTGIGLGVTMVTINIYISEIVPRHLRGRASAFSLSVQCTAIPVAALIAWRLVPMEPFGVSGWRWVVGLGGLGVIPAWVIYARLAESPRWMVAKGKSLFEDGSPIFGSETRRKGPANARDRVSGRRAQFAELFHRRYIRRVVMFSLFHATHTIGIYGFIQWGPSFLVSRGIPLAHSLAYSLFGAAVLPIGPVIALTFADRWERKWQIVTCLAGIAVTGLVYGNSRSAVPIIISAAILNLSSTILVLNYNAYQAELFPTHIRAMAVGFVYSWNRLAGIFSGFIIVFVLGKAGVSAVFSMIAGCMALAACVIATLGPTTRNKPLEVLTEGLV